MPIKTRTIWVPRGDLDLAGVNNFLRQISAYQYVSMDPQPAVDGARQFNITYEDRVSPELVDASIHNGSALHEDYIPTGIVIQLSTEIEESFPDGSFLWALTPGYEDVPTSTIDFDGDEITIPLPDLTGYEGPVTLIGNDLVSKDGVPARSSVVTSFHVLSRDKFPTSERPAVSTKSKEMRYGVVRISRLVVAHSAGTPEDMIAAFKAKHSILDDQILEIVNRGGETTGYTDIYLAWFTTLAPRPISISPIPGTGLASEAPPDKIIIGFDTPVEGLSKDDIEFSGPVIDYDVEELSEDKTLWGVSLTGLTPGHLTMFISPPNRGGDRLEKRRMYSWNVTPRTVDGGGGGGSFTGDHNDIDGRSDLNAHPASSITNTPSGGISATTVQNAINELDTDKEAAGTAAAAVSAHEAASDPHTGYQKESEKNSNSGYCGLDSSGLVDRAQQTAGPNIVYRRSGSPEGVLTAVTGSVCLDDSGGVVYVKASGSGNTGWVALAKITDVITAHSGLSGLSGVGVHPASSITNTPSGGISATDIQAAVNELDTEKEAAGTAAAAIAAHEGASDPHTGYQKESEKGSANGYASLDSSTKVPIAEIPTGTSGTTVSLGNHNHAGVYEPVDATILRQADVDDIPVDGATTAPVSSNWAYDHTGGSDPHSVYQLESEKDQDSGYVGISSLGVVNRTMACDIISKSSSYTIVPATDRGALIIVDASSGNKIMTLPPVAGAKEGFIVGVMKGDVSGNTVTVDADALETINGTANKTLSTQYDTEWYVCDGTEWKAYADRKTASAGSGDFMADGSVPMTADFDGGGNSLTNIADGVAPTDAATVGQLPGTDTGWTFPTGTAVKTGFDSETVTLRALARHLKALIDCLMSGNLPAP